MEETFFENDRTNLLKLGKVGDVVRERYVALPGESNGYFEKN